MVLVDLYLHHNGWLAWGFYVGKYSSTIRILWVSEKTRGDIHRKKWDLLADYQNGWVFRGESDFFPETPVGVFDHQNSPGVSGVEHLFPSTDHSDHPQFANPCPVHTKNTPVFPRPGTPMECGSIPDNQKTPYLLGGWATPLKKIRVRQLGWWNSQWIWENAKLMATKAPPTRYAFVERGCFSLQTPWLGGQTMSSHGQPGYGYLICGPAGDHHCLSYQVAIPRCNPYGAGRFIPTSQRVIGLGFLCW